MSQETAISATPKASSSSTPRSLNRQVVLDEDEYTEALSHIIARDFFPSLVHIGATNEYLDALKSHDPELIGATVRRLEQLSTPRTARTSYVQQTPSQTPYGTGPSDTPLRTPRGEPPAKRARYDTNLSLDGFQARYTSEDNSSFTQILDEENRRRKEKYGWAWDAQRRVEQQRDRMIEGRERLLIEAPAGTGVREKFLIEAPAPAGLLTQGSESHPSSASDVEPQLGEKGEDKEGGVKEDNGKGKEVVRRTEGGSGEDEDEEARDVMAPKKDTRAAGVDGWEFKVSLVLALCYSQSSYTILDEKCSHVPSGCRRIPLPPQTYQHLRRC